ncbi:DUF2076 domain-containing protein [Rosenbergiella australiborealis]|uniref:DUF2076 domain-containing protein n=1 Tax=Rosenbergiella australiborealis TaxID=1544696 RepID=A0ABS5T6U7_9GAMM|nr:DUF2076 domain-containing protein [Rosenbergiella australiborealis]MBT0728062.1 DUF2076 domain-containing protein [Rosenbergiella australiborealis]
MQTDEQKLIDDLFGRLQQAETQSSARDSGAEQRIKQHLQAQPDAPYYMTQAIIIQEAALKKLNDRVAQLERQIAEQPKQSSGGFLSGLFGGGNSRPQSAPQQNSGWGGSNPQSAAPQQGYAPAPQQPAARGTGFLGGALQTAVGVAGGVVMADMLTSMFHHSQPEEIVNIINEPPLEQPNYDSNFDTFNQQADASNFDHSWDAPQNDDSSSFFGDSSFGDDDDSFL